jgi:anti-sigma B factor antagonist
VRAVESVGGAVVVRLSGELDLHNVEEIRAALSSVAGSAPDRVVVDLEQVEFIDSTALGALVEARKLLAPEAPLVLAAPQAEARRALDVSGLAGYFGIHETVADALAAA